MSTLEGWAMPIGSTGADHTFVYCREYMSYFYCWNNGDINAEGAVKICTGIQENAYARADCYRCNLPFLPDTAGIGIYAVNGVCHQSANCFLFAAGTQLSLVNGRPGGLGESTAAYGAYGSMSPFADSFGIGEGLHWIAWHEGIYNPCSSNKDKRVSATSNVSAISNDLLFQETHQLYERLRTQPQGANAADVKISDLALLIKHALPGLSLDLEKIANLQRSYLQEHDGFLGAEFPKTPETKVIDEKSAERVNKLSAQFQKALAQQIGPDNYMKLTGRGPNETIELINPEILENAQRAASQR